MPWPARFVESPTSPLRRHHSDRCSSWRRSRRSSRHLLSVQQLRELHAERFRDVFQQVDRRPRQSGFNACYRHARHTDLVGKLLLSQSALHPHSTHHRAPLPPLPLCLSVPVVRHERLVTHCVTTCQRLASDSKGSRRKSTSRYSPFACGTIASSICSFTI